MITEETDVLFIIFTCNDPRNIALFSVSINYMELIICLIDKIFDSVNIILTKSLNRLMFAKQTVVVAFASF